MGVIPLLVVCSVAVAALFLLAFLWANRDGQYDDLQTPAIRMLFEDRHMSTPASMSDHTSMSDHPGMSNHANTKH